MFAAELWNDNKAAGWPTGNCCKPNP